MDLSIEHIESIVNVYNNGSSSDALDFDIYC